MSNSDFSDRVAAINTLVDAAADEDANVGSTVYHIGNAQVKALMGIYRELRAIRKVLEKDA